MNRLTGLPLAYLLPTDAQNKLIVQEKYTLETVPPIERLDYLLGFIETRIDDWLGFRPVLMDYEDNLRTNSAGVCLLKNYPAQEIKGVAIAPVTVSPGKSYRPYKVCFSWDGGRQLFTNICCGRVIVSYSAGYSPLPPIFAEVVYEILEFLLMEADSTRDLNRPTKDISSLSLPGGLSQSFRLGNLPKEMEGDELSRFLTPLYRYKRKIET